MFGVGSPPAHRVGADIRLPDVVAEDDEDVRLGSEEVIVWAVCWACDPAPSVSVRRRDQRPAPSKMFRRFVSAVTGDVGRNFGPIFFFCLAVHFHSPFSLRKLKSSRG